MDEMEGSSSVQKKKKQTSSPAAPPGKLSCNVHLPSDWHGVVGNNPSPQLATVTAGAAASNAPSHAAGEHLQQTRISIKCNGNAKKLRSLRNQQQQQQADPPQKKKVKRKKKVDEEAEQHDNEGEIATATLSGGGDEPTIPPILARQAKRTPAAVAAAPNKKSKPCFSPSAPSFFTPPPLQPPLSVMHAGRSGAGGLSSSSNQSSSSAVGTPSSTGTLPHSTRDACENILAAIQRSGFAAAAAAANAPIPSKPAVNLDHILSKVPYKDMLKDLFGSNASCTRGYKAPSIPVVSRLYEESYMRQPIYEYERQCVMAAECECNFIGSNAGEGFVGVEFLLPSEAAAAASADVGLGSASHERHKQQMCVLCHRRLVQSLFHDIIYSGSPYRGIIQRYGNICNQENEYAR